MRVPSNNSRNRMRAIIARRLQRRAQVFTRHLGPFLLRPWRCAPAHPLVSGRRLSALETIIDIHVSRSLKGTEGDQTTTGFQRTINLPGRQPPHRRCGKLKRLFASITLSALRLLGSRPPQQSATGQSPISAQEQQCQPCGRASQRCRTVRATKESTCCSVGSGAKTTPARRTFAAPTSYQLCLYLDRGVIRRAKLTP